MQIDNRTLIRKADLALSDLTTAGKLQPAQAQKFIRLLIDEGVILKMATVVPMKSQQQLIEKIRFGSRIMRPGAEATALTATERVKPDLSKVTLTAKHYKAEVRLNNETLEDSIERGELRQTIMQQMAEAISRDIDELVIQGDTTNTSDDFLATMDGMIKQATSHVVNAGTVTLNKTIFRDMLKSMPSPFLRNKDLLRFLTSVDAEIDYRDGLMERATAIGDRYIESGAPVSYTGIPVVPVPLMPENLGGGNNTTDVILTDPKNVHVGIWREVTLETGKDVSAGVLIIVASLRFDMKYAEETAVVKATNVKVSA